MALDGQRADNADMKTFTRARRWIGPCLFAGGLAAMPSLGPTTTSNAVNQIVNSATQGAPVAPPAAAVPPSDLIWVPDRYVPVVGQATPAYVPGHWEQKIDARRSYAPPLPVIDQYIGAVGNTPAGIRETPPSERIGP
jgi:hypothetical protein